MATLQKNVKDIKFNRHEHPFHLVKPSPWPFFTAMSLLPILLDTVKYLHRYEFSRFELKFFIVFFIFSVSHWFWDIIVEATFEGRHTTYVQNGLLMGFALFIVSEVMFFFSFFWAFFYFSVSPSIWIGNTWPPLGIKTINPWGLPLLNTVILLSSGVTVTWAHKAILPCSQYEVEQIYRPYFCETDNLYRIRLFPLTDFEHEEYYSTLLAVTYFHRKSYFKELIVRDIEEDGLVVELDAQLADLMVRAGKRRNVTKALMATIAYGCLFTMLQLHEYKTALFSINDSVYGSIFYLMTGFHGLHVIIGTLFLFVCLIRHINYHFTTAQHIGLEMAIWYWHFVDVVWLFLFIIVYWWGS